MAICEQLEDPKQVKGLVKRGVIELVTPGVVLGDNILANKENTYLAAVYFGRKNTGVAFLDISTGEFYAAEGSDAYIDKLISNLAPKEIIYQRGYEDRFSDAFGSRHYTYRLDEWVFSESVNRDKLCKQFGTQSLKGFGIEQFSSGISAAGAILYYLEFTEHKNTAHISSISRIDQEDYVWVDKFTIRNLELFSSNGSREKCAFADVVDRTLTPMGGRLLKRWIALPIKEIDRINERLDVVQRFYDEPDLAESVAEQISQVGDLERIASRIAAARVTPAKSYSLKIRFRRSNSSKPCWNRPTTSVFTRWPDRSICWRRFGSVSPARFTPTRRTIRFSGAALSPTAWTPNWTICAASLCMARIF